MRDDDDYDDEAPTLTNDEAVEVLALVTIAAGEHIADESPLGGDVDDLVEHALDHRLGECSVWVRDTMLNLSLCPVCGSVSLCLLAKDSDYLHGFIEMVERLRLTDGIGGDPDDLLVTYRRIRVIVGDVPTHAYVVRAIYGLDLDDVEDRVMHATRALVTVLDTVAALIAEARERAAGALEDD